MYNITICSINVNGLRNQVKRRQIFNSCNSQDVDILLLQETHVAGYMEPRAWVINLAVRGSGLSLVSVNLKFVYH